MNVTHHVENSIFVAACTPHTHMLFPLLCSINDATSMSSLHRPSQAAVVDATAEIARQQVRMTDLRAAAAANDDAVTAECERLRTACSELEQRIAAHESASLQATARCSELAMANAELVKSDDQLRQDLASAIAQRDEALKEVEALRARGVGAESEAVTEAAHLRQRVAALEGFEQRASEQRAAAVAELEAVQASERLWKKRADELSARLKALEAERVSLIAERDELAASVRNGGEVAQTRAKGRCAGY